MAINASDIHKLREETGGGVMECKRALEEANGDFDRAISIIRERGEIKAAKKADRAAGAGIVFSYVHNDRVGVLLDIRCETDFVAKNESFRELAREVAMQITAMNPESVKDLYEQPYIRDDSKTIEQLVKSYIAKTGENLKVEKFCRYEV